MTRVIVLFAIGVAAASIVEAAGDAAVGRKLVEAKGCETCHARQNLEGAGAIYLRKDRKVHSMDELTAQVGRCNHGLGLHLSASDERDVVSFLNETYYRFK